MKFFIPSCPTNFAQKIRMKRTNDYIIMQCVCVLNEEMFQEYNLLHISTIIVHLCMYVFQSRQIYLSNMNKRKENTLQRSIINSKYISLSNNFMKCKQLCQILKDTFFDKGRIFLEIKYDFDIKTRPNQTLSDQQPAQNILNG